MIPGILCTCGTRTWTIIEPSYGSHILTSPCNFGPTTSFVQSRSSSIWDFRFHSYVLTIYVRLYSILELVVFYSLVRRGYIRKVSVQLVPKHFSRDCSTDSISCSKRKNRKKTILKQDSKSRKEDQNVVVVTNPPGLSSLRCRTAIALLSLRCLSNVAPQ